jgi:CDP-L-myo-inositol myo-inositolphosphotransferase
VLLPVNGRGPLIAYPINALVAAGIRDIAIVVGYLGNRVSEALGDGSRLGARLHYVHNPDYEGGNALSVHRAREWVGGDSAVVCMGDHLVEERLIRRLVAARPRGETLCIDRSPAAHHDIDEATKVKLDDAGCIAAIGKDLDGWDALDTGVFLLGGSFFEALAGLVRERGIHVEMGDVVRHLIAQGHRFGTCDVTGCYWIDVDTPEDLEKTGR